MRAQFSRTMLEIGKQDPNLFVLVGDIGAFGLREFAEQCKGRFLNAGIREQAMIGTAAGLALTGFVPVIHSITPFVVERCFEQIKDDFCYQQLPANIISVGAGFDYSALGCTHHSYSDIASMVSLPGSKVFYPGSPSEFDLLFKSVYASGSLNYFRLGGRNHPIVFKPQDILPGKSISIQEGSDLTLLVSGPLLENAVKALQGFSKFKIEVIYSPSIKPFDSERLIASVKKTKRLLVVEDHSVNGGLGAQALRSIQGLNTSFKSKLLGIEDQFLRGYGAFENLCEEIEIDPKGILRNIEELCRE